MRRMVLPIVLLFAVGCARQPATPSSGGPQSTNSQSPAPLSEAELKALASLEPIDTHTHVAKGDPSFYAMLDQLHMHIVDILLVNDHDKYRNGMQPQLQDALRVVHESQGHAVLCTTFNPFQFGQPGFRQSVIRALNQDFREGAVAVKIWKNIGMELKDQSGNYIMPDNPAFGPIYKDIETHHKTLIAHVAEPDASWQPPDPNSPDYSYYEQNPVWYMYRHPEAPKKKQILDARDHLLARNPNLRVVGAHLGSMEDDLQELGERLDRYPNFAVDTAARVPHLMIQPRDRVRAFILKYQDRILYATDLEFLPDEAAKDAVSEWEGQYALDWRYFSTNDWLEYSNHKIQGLGLPDAVLRKLYHENAVRWIPGIVRK
jgi:predicted TIM-barrel fold metal-dependent hydrolase